MHIKWENDVMIMSSSIVCENYADMKHFTNTFERVGDNEFKCTACNTIMTIKEPVLIHDEKGKLKIRVSTEPKR